MKLSERIHQWGIACESPTLFGFANEVAQLEAELETYRSGDLFKWMVATKEAEAENAAAFELLDVYEKENERLREWLAKAGSLIGYYCLETGMTTGEAWDELRRNKIPHLEHGEMWYPDALKEGG